MYHILLLLENNCNLNGHCDNAYLRFQKSKYDVSDAEFETGSLQDAYKLDDFKETCLHWMCLFGWSMYIWMSVN